MGFLFRGTRSKGPDWTVQLIGPDRFFADLIRVLFICVQKRFPSDPVFTRINNTRIKRDGSSFIPGRTL